jgi:SAM-dependent methyltransferase
MKLNVGCGFRKEAGYLNLDKSPACGPDQVMDAEAFPWPFADSSVDEVLFHHSLEHMGAKADVFLRLLQELYRVCRPGAKVRVNVIHPRHDDFFNDPTRVRRISPDLMCLFSKRENRIWQQNKASNSLMAFYLDVDFEVRIGNSVLDPAYGEALERGQLTRDQLGQMVKSRNNIVRAYQIELEVLK